jgi:hypothetical protein
VPSQKSLDPKTEHASRVGDRESDRGLIRDLVEKRLTAVTDSGPTGWIAAVAITALFLAGFCVYAMMKISMLNH